MTLPDWMTKVTPLSKSIALAMLGGLPFLGFIAGMKYQKKVTIFPVRGSDIKIVRVQQTETVEDLIHRCGDYPEKIYGQRMSLYIPEGMSWSSDCRYVAWSQTRSPKGQGYMEDVGYQPVDRSDEGLWLYQDKTEKIRKLNIENKTNNLIMFLNWINNDKLQFEIGNEKMVYDLYKERVILNE